MMLWWFAHVFVLLFDGWIARYPVNGSFQLLVNVANGSASGGFPSRKAPSGRSIVVVEAGGLLPVNDLARGPRDFFARSIEILENLCAQTGWAVSKVLYAAEVIGPQ